jgi:hypothetical protein
MWGPASRLGVGVLASQVGELRLSRSPVRGSCLGGQVVSPGVWAQFLPLKQEMSVSMQTMRPNIAVELPGTHYSKCPVINAHNTQCLPES